MTNTVEVPSWLSSINVSRVLTVIAGGVSMDMADTSAAGFVSANADVMAYAALALALIQFVKKVMADGIAAAVEAALKASQGATKVVLFALLLLGLAVPASADTTVKLTHFSVVPLESLTTRNGGTETALIASKINWMGPGKWRSRWSRGRPNDNDARLTVAAWEYAPMELGFHGGTIRFRAIDQGTSKSYWVYCPPELAEKCRMAAAGKIIERIRGQVSEVPRLGKGRRQ